MSNFRGLIKVEWGALMVLALTTGACSRQMGAPSVSGGGHAVVPTLRENTQPPSEGGGISTVHHEDCKNRLGTAYANCVIALDEGTCETCSILSDADVAPPAPVATEAMLLDHLVPSAMAANHDGAQLPKHPLYSAQRFGTVPVSSTRSTCNPLRISQPIQPSRTDELTLDPDAQPAVENEVEVLPVFRNAVSVAFDGGVGGDAPVSGGAFCLYKKPNRGNIACVGVPARHRLRVKLPALLQER